jgi:hypothetical protein
MVIAPIVGMLLLKLALLAINRGAVRIGQAAIQLAKLCVRRQSFGLGKAATYLGAVADWLLGRPG